MSALTPTASSQYGVLLGILKEWQHLVSAKNVLDWDAETGMPDAASGERGEVAGYLAGLAHDKLVSNEVSWLLTRLETLQSQWQIPADGAEAAVIRLTRKMHDREAKFTTQFVQEMTALCTSAHTVWKNAREANDWEMFRPSLERMVVLKRREAKLLGYEKSPYDALIDYYEPGMTAAKVQKLLGSIVEPLSDLVRRVGASKAEVRPEKGEIDLAIDIQKMLNKRIAAKLGFDFSRGLLAETTHPFMMRLHANDARIATRFRKEDFLYGLGSTIHESGHGMYEQGLPVALFSTMAGEAPSLGIHESQSRFWERLIGSSKPFCLFLQRQLADIGQSPEVDDLYAYLNAVRPSFIRTEADEVTYNLHVCMRFEIELALIEGRLEVKDVPEKWNELSRKYLGITPPTLAEGCLQDVHWAAGLFGYFPTYAIGNLYSAQLYATMVEDLGGQRAVNAKVALGEFAPILEWLREKVHRHGSIKTADQIVRDATGTEPDASHFLAYVERKCADLYGI
jgi:carboxypeptidase Taq